MPSTTTHTRPGRYAVAAIAGVVLAVGLALLTPGGWSQPADADDGELGTEVVKTLAGTPGESDFSGDGGRATDAQLNNPFDMAVDAIGNTYIADTFNQAVRKVDPSGTITTVASGDDGLSFPVGVAVDSHDNAYVLEFNGRVRKIDPSGAITTFADLGAGADAGLGVDSSDNLYIPDESNDRVVKVDPSGTMTTVAGTGEPGFAGDGGQATEAELDGPNGIAIDGDDNVYIADLDNNRIRKVDASGIITTVAGNGSSRSNGDGGAATDGAIGNPRALAVDGEGAVYIGSFHAGGDRVRKVDTDGIISTVAGGADFTEGFEEGIPPTEASLSPEGLFVDTELGLLIADTANSQVLQMTHVPDLVAISDLTASPNPVNVDDELTYTINVANPGLAGDANGVTVTLPLPEEAEFSAAGPSQGSCVEADETVTCELGELPEGATATVPITVTPTAPVIFEGVEASITADGDDPHPRNNSASTVTVVGDVRCGEVLTEDTTLTDDVGPCPNNGLVVGADDITVDLNGHEVIGWRGYEGFGFDDDIQLSEGVSELLGTSREVGVLLADRHDATVESGSVTGFSAGVALVHGSSGNTVQSLTVHDNIGLDPFSHPELGDGIFVSDSPGNVIADNTVTHNGYYDNIGVWGPDSDRTEITGNLVQESPPTTIGSSIFGMGIIVNGADEAQGTITGMTIANNTVRDNRSHGISNTNGFDAKIVNNLVEHNGHRYSAMHSIGGRGIGVSTGRELRDADANVTVVGNTVRNNRRDGIHIQARGNKIINNTSLDNAEFKDGELAGEGLFDFTDRTSDTCEYNRWNNNEWGSAGYHPECTSTRGLGKGKNPAAGADPGEPEGPEMRSRSAPSFDDIGQ